jgi:DNA-binding CsgD family transcriptional regulator
MSSILNARPDGAAVATLLERMGEHVAAARDREARAQAAVTGLRSLPSVLGVGLVLEGGGRCWAGEGTESSPPPGAHRVGCSLQVDGRASGELTLWCRGTELEPVVGLVLRSAAPWLALVLGPPQARGAYREELRERLTRAQGVWRLTQRQVQVLSFVARGDANKEIAATLRCAERTVEIHVTELLKKSGSSGRAMLTARFWSEL